ncbi:hypothetical protein ES676_09655 [Bizionia saleffrena]|uniref:Uncharacterized protein n=1 Tax=Bizionia saleffrena TaxID=291189 RepID=A0A8H2LE11_9FLAO|nr:hypothetical protein [Bizionia saleffrena]TYB73013.1 hypothetical protein ES676_09655 [Bizionia saleffrena]
MFYPNSYRLFSALLFIYAKWTYSHYDEENKTHMYYDNYESNLAIDLSEKTITWLTERENSQWSKAIKYINLIKDDSVKPQ